MNIEKKPENRVLQSPDEINKAFIQEIRPCLEQKDRLRMADLILADVFVFGAAAEAVSIGRDKFLPDLRSQFEQVKQAQLHPGPMSAI